MNSEPRLSSHTRFSPTTELLRTVCIARHLVLAEHVCAIVRGPTLSSVPAVGLSHGVALALERRPHAVLCDYDLLASAALDGWHGNPLLAAMPLIAVSLTRQPEEVVSINDSLLAAFLYLPTLTAETVGRIVRSVAVTHALSHALPPDRPASRDRSGPRA